MEKLDLDDLSILYLKEPVGFVAQCLEYDIAAQGDTIDDARKSLKEVMDIEYTYLKKKGKDWCEVPETPPWYWEQYEKTNQRLIEISYTELDQAVD